MDIIREIAAVTVVLGLLCALLWRLRRRGFAGILTTGRPRSRQLECVERLALGPQHTIHLIRIGSRGLLVTSSPSGCALMESFPWREVDGPREAPR
jgi:flagellar biogenesis protein FliO